MEIQVAAGVGAGSTSLAAFDAALNQAGIADRNVLVLSSVIPPGATVKEVSQISGTGEWGDRLYVVMAHEEVDTSNAEAWSGVGWVQGDDGRGLFVEHHGASESRVRKDIEDSLADMTKARPENFGPVHMKLSNITCESDPVCSIVVARYQSASW